MKSALRNQKIRSPLTPLIKGGIKGGLFLFVAMVYLLLPQVSHGQGIRQRLACPSDLETLITWMLKDLPSYGNRVTQRSRRGDRTVDVYNYIILAGKPEFEPLPLTNLQYEPVLADDTKQVFFTTLERQYTKTEVVLLQNYYWLFLTPSSDGWRLVLLFSQLADLQQGDLPLPPQDAMNGAIGQGIKLWLKDCRAGVLRG